MESLSESATIRNSVIYRLYPKSFFDFDGDGIGDIKGITAKLSYFLSLGVDVISISSVFETDSDEITFNTTDFMRVNPALGTLRDFEELLEEAHKLQLKIYLSFPISFTSTAHPWFEKSRASTSLNPYREYYIWHAGKGKSAPDNKRSSFKSPLWTYDDKSGEWYRCYNGSNTPQLNFDNPRVRKEILDVLRFWREKGVDGFIVENAFFTTDKLILDNRTLLYKADEGFFAEGRGLYRMLRDIKERVESDFPLLLDPENVHPGLYPYLLTNEKPIVDALYATDLIKDDRLFQKGSFSFKDFVKAYLSTQSTDLSDKTCLPFDGKDYSRLLSNLISQTNPAFIPAAKMLCALLFTARSVPSIYQGEEIGMTDYAPFKANDAKGYTMAPDLLHSRSPFQWDNNPNAAFTDCDYPFFLVNDNYHKINLLSQYVDGESIFSFYRKMIEMRKTSSALRNGEFIDRSEGNVLCFLRESKTERLLIVANASHKSLNAKLPANLVGQSALCEICNYGVVSKTLNATMGLRPYEVRVFRLSSPLLALN